MSLRPVGRGYSSPIFPQTDVQNSGTKRPPDSPARAPQTARAAGYSTSRLGGLFSGGSGRGASSLLAALPMSLKPRLNSRNPFPNDAPTSGIRLAPKKSRNTPPRMSQCVMLNSPTVPPQQCVRQKSNAPGRIRTSDQQLRRLLLYPPELRAPDSAATLLTAPNLMPLCREDHSHGRPF